MTSQKTIERCREKLKTSEEDNKTLGDNCLLLSKENVDLRKEIDTLKQKIALLTPTIEPRVDPSLLKSVANGQKMWIHTSGAYEMSMCIGDESTLELAEDLFKILFSGYHNYFEKKEIVEECPKSRDLFISRYCAERAGASEQCQ